MERVERDTARRAAMHNGHPLFRDTMDDAPIGELLQRVASDASLLVQQEISLAKSELRETAKQAKAVVAGLAIAALLAVPGALALTAFLVIALGVAIGSYWASALIVGAGLTGIAVLLARKAIATVRDGRLALDETAESLRDEAAWGKEELRAFKRELTA